MADFYRRLTPEHVEFIHRQRIFFTGSAPMDGGRVNVSPKGYDTLRVLDDATIAYLDFVGSGNETANHILENGRLTFMWCSFETRPLILRAYCYGELVEKGTPRFAQMMADLYPAYDPNHVRRIVVGRVESVQTSCGYGVPYFQYVGERRTMAEWSERKHAQGELEQFASAHAMRSEEKFPLEPPGVPPCREGALS